jgi:glycine/D-amino acid oxidase-like deaminating enzyme
VAGPWAGQVAAFAGARLNVQGTAIQVTVTDRWQLILHQLIASIEGGLTLKQTPEGIFAIGGGWPATRDPFAEKIALDRDSLAGNLGFALRVLPGLAKVPVLRTWFGPIAQCYDERGQLLQILGESPDLPGFYTVSGGMLFTLGPLYARLAAELISRGRTSYRIDVHNPSRFSRQR